MKIHPKVIRIHRSGYLDVTSPRQCHTALIRLSILTWLTELTKAWDLWIFIKMMSYFREQVSLTIIFFISLQMKKKRLYYTHVFPILKTNHTFLSSEINRQTQINHNLDRIKKKTSPPLVLQYMIILKNKTNPIEMKGRWQLVDVLNFKRYIPWSSVDTVFQEK